MTHSHADSDLSNALPALGGWHDLVTLPPPLPVRIPSSDASVRDTVESVAELLGVSVQRELRRSSGFPRHAWELRPVC